MSTFAGRWSGEFFDAATGRPLPNLVVPVVLRGTSTPAVLYTERTKAAVVVPGGQFTTDAVGNGTFLAAPGDLYDFLVNGTRVPVSVPADPAEPGPNGYRSRPGWFLAPGMVTAVGSITQGYLWLMPVRLAETITIDQVNIQVTTAVAGSTIQPLIYLPLASGVPGARLYAGPSLAAATIGVKTDNLGTPLVLPAGLLWMGAMAAGGSPSTYVGYGAPEEPQPGVALSLYAGAISIGPGVTEATDPAPTTGYAPQNFSPRLSLRMV